MLCSIQTCLLVCFCKERIAKIQIHKKSNNSSVKIKVSAEPLVATITTLSLPCDTATTLSLSKSPVEIYVDGVYHSLVVAVWQGY